MPRALRIEYSGALYHVLNRGNYRQDLFSSEGAAQAFETTLFETADRFGWVVHAYVVMSNHYHLAMETPRANLSAGMQYLQSVFANRFNRYRRERGHVFQGRYKALIIEPGLSLVRVVDYIHLNPVRAGIVPLEQLRDYEHGSFPKWFERKSQRPACLHDERWRQIAGYKKGERELRRYWAELALKRENDPDEHERLRRELCRGWFIGAREWALELLEEYQQDKLQLAVSESEPEDKEATWEILAQRYIRESGHSEEDLTATRKSAPWKLGIAWKIKSRTGATNSWLAKRLLLGNPSSASQNIKRWKTQKSHT